MKEIRLKNRNSRNSEEELADIFASYIFFFFLYFVGRNNFLDILEIDISRQLDLFSRFPNGEKLGIGGK